MSKEYKNIDYRVKYFDKCVEVDKIKRKYEKAVRRNERKQKNIDKAIEYIEDNCLWEENEGKEFEYAVANDSKARKDLLSILRGEEDE